MGVEPFTFKVSDHVTLGSPLIPSSCKSPTSPLTRPTHSNGIWSPPTMLACILAFFLLSSAELLPPQGLHLGGPPARTFFPPPTSLLHLANSSSCLGLCSSTTSLGSLAFPPLPRLASSSSYELMSTVYFSLEAFTTRQIRPLLM